MLERLKRKRPEHSRVGIDLQSDGIAVAVVRQAGKSPISRLSCEFLPCDDPAEQLAAVMEKTVHKHDLRDQPVVLVLPHSEYSLLQTSVPALGLSEMRAAAGWKIGELIDYPVSDAVVDVFEYPESGQRGSERMLYVVASRATQIQSHVDRLRQSELELKAIDIPELVIRNVVTYLPENEQGVVVLSLAERSGLLVVIKQSEVYLTRRLELGFDDLLLGDPHTFDDLVLQLQRSLDFFESRFAQALPAKVLMFPPDKVSGELIMHVNSHLKLDVEPLILEQLPDFSIDMDEAGQTRCLNAIGAALRDREAVA
jgi:MSHA biogenesis protein MshI